MHLRLPRPSVSSNALIGDWWADLPEPARVEAYVLDPPAPRYRNLLLSFNEELSSPPGKEDMLFLIEYQRNQGRIVTIKSFTDADRERAEESRLELELELNLQGIENEVVLLDAASEDALRRTHRRYFEDLAQLTTAPVDDRYRNSRELH